MDIHRDSSHEQSNQPLSGLRHVHTLLVVVVAVLLLATATLGSTLITSAAPSQDSGSWEKLDVGRGPRSFNRSWVPAAAFDTPAERMLMFRTVGTGTELWSLNLEAGKEEWTQVRPSGHSPRNRWSAAAAMDEAGRRLVVFGGIKYASERDIVVFGDTYIVDESGEEPVWRTVDSADVPAKRFGASLVAVPVRRGGAVERMVLFGGTGISQMLSDTWVLELEQGKPETWSELNACGTRPPARTGHTAIYDARGHRMLVFAGSDTRTQFDDTWALDLEEGAECWSRIEPEEGAAPNFRDARFEMAMFDSCGTSARAIVVAGVAPFVETWQLTLTEPGKERWEKLSVSGRGPGVRDHVAASIAVGDSVNRRLVHLNGLQLWTLQLAPCPAPTMMPTASPGPTDTPPPAQSATPEPTASATETEPPTAEPTRPSPTATATPTEVPWQPIYLPRLFRDPSD